MLNTAMVQTMKHSNDATMIKHEFDDWVVRREKQSWTMTTARKINKRNER